MKRKPPKPFPKGVSGNPGGQSKEKRAFLDRLKAEDAEEVYAAFLDLVRERNAPAVLRAVEYVAGKPKESVELSGKDGEPIGLNLTAKQLLKYLDSLDKQLERKPNEDASQAADGGDGDGDSTHAESTREASDVDGDGADEREVEPG